MKNGKKQVISLVLAVILCVGMLPGFTAQAAGNAMSLSETRALLNRVELHPQRTGYAEMDRLLGNILAPYADRDPYTKIKAMYDWSVYNVTYSWAGYSQDYAPAYDKFTLRYDLTYEPGLPKAIPEEMIHRSYHSLTAKTGVCYDWAALFAIMARYVGVESYVHTGILRIGDWTGHHGWTVLRIGGQDYIFDAQQDVRLYGNNGVVTYEYFGIPRSRWYDYTPETDVNDVRDAGFLPITSSREKESNVTVQVSGGHRVSGDGRHPWGEEVTLTAEEGIPFKGWYNSRGVLLSSDTEYTLIPEGDVKLYALFEGDYFLDVSHGSWYFNDMREAVDMGLITGINDITFQPEGTMTRAMLATVLARAAGADVEAAGTAPFGDVDQNEWYAGSVNWAYENGVVYGESETRFNPSGRVTREQAATMIMRYLESRDIAVDAEESSSFADAEKISGFAKTAVAQAEKTGILTGYPDGTIRPKNTITRSEGVACLMRMVRYAA